MYIYAVTMAFQISKRKFFIAYNDQIVYFWSYTFLPGYFFVCWIFHLINRRINQSNRLDKHMIRKTNPHSPIQFLRPVSQLSGMIFNLFPQTYFPFFASSFDASPKTSISFTSHRRKGSGWKTPSPENHIVKDVSISFS